VEWVWEGAGVVVKRYVGTYVKFGKDQALLLLRLVEELISLSLHLGVEHRYQK